MYSGVKGGRYTNVGISKAEKFSFSSRNPKLGFSLNDTNMIIGGHSNIRNGNGGLSIHGKHIGLLIHSDQISGLDEHKQILKIYTNTSGSDTGAVFFEARESDKPMYFRGRDGSSFITALEIDYSDGGHAKFTGDITAFNSSDINLKKNIVKIKDPLKKLDKLNGYTFEWNENTKKEGSSVGVIAQEVESVFPELTSVQANGYKGVQYDKLVPLLIESIKDQQKQIVSLKERIDTLEKK